MPIEYILGIVTVFTSAIAGVFGLGGGMVLIAVLPIYLPPSIIIPIHGVTQLASNSSRMFLSFKHVEWVLLPKFLLGSAIGLTVFGLLFFNIPTEYIPVAIGSYILLNLWCKPFIRFIKKYESYYVLGFLQTGLGLLVGATGPLAITLLTKDLGDRDKIIATSSLFMTIGHLSKIVIFGVVGFAYSQHWLLLALMVLGSVLGSIIGTKIRQKIDTKNFILILNLVLSALAIRMLVGVFI